MTISQTGGPYNYPNEIQRRDRAIGGALDDRASQIQAVRSQGNFGPSGPPQAPSPPAQLSVSAANGIIQAVITHPNPPPGAIYRIEYSTTPNFLNPIPVDLGEVPVFHASLPAQKLYFRAATKLPSSPLSPYVYFGGSATPTLVSS